MADRTFDLNLYDTTRTGLLTASLLLGILGVIGIGGWVGFLVANAGAGAWGLLAWLVVTVGLMYVSWPTYHRLAIVPLRVTINATQICVEDPRPAGRLTHTVPYADLVSYRYADDDYNNSRQLVLVRREGRPLKLLEMAQLCPAPGFGTMRRAFEDAVAAAPTHGGEPVRRERSFFEQAVSTYVLIGSVVVMVGMIGAALFTNRRVGEALFPVTGAFFVYLRAWSAAAKRRNAP